jgi:MFS family permease
MNMILPELPGYLDSMGGQDYKGAIIGLFTITACISRPFSGRLTDTIGRVPVILFGTTMAIITNALYIFVPTVIGFLILRLIHGLTVGFNATGTTAYISDVVPIEKRGEAMGFFGLMNNVGAGLAPLLGSFITKEYGINYMFMSASVFALLSAFVFWNIKETHKNKVPFKPALLILKKQDLAERRVWLPALIMILMIFSFGTMLTVGFDLAEKLKSPNKGIILMITTLSSILIRVIAGKFSDRFGRKTAMLFGLITLTIGLILMGNAKSLHQLYLASFIVGMANGMNNPTIFAWVTDWSNPKNKGRAISTLFIALEAGIGMGAFISAEIYANKLSNIPDAFYTASILSTAALILLVSTWKHKPKLILE